MRVVAEPGHEDHGKRLVEFLRGAEHFVAVSIRHPDVGDHQVEPGLARLHGGDRARSVLVGLDRRATAFENPGDRLADGGFIVRHQHASPLEHGIVDGVFVVAGAENRLRPGGAGEHAGTHRFHRGDDRVELLGHGPVADVSGPELGRVPGDRLQRLIHLAQHGAREVVIRRVPLDHQHVEDVDRHRDVPTVELDDHLIAFIEGVDPVAFDVQDADHAVAELERNRQAASRVGNAGHVERVLADVGADVGLAARGHHAGDSVLGVSGEDPLADRERLHARPHDQFELAAASVDQADLEVLESDRAAHGPDHLVLDQAETGGDVERVDGVGIEIEQVATGVVDLLDEEFGSLEIGDVADQGGHGAT